MKDINWLLYSGDYEHLQNGKINFGAVENFIPKILVIRLSCSWKKIFKHSLFSHLTFSI